MQKIINKFINSSPAVKASMALLFANLVLKGLSLISGPVFTRIMSSSQYGIVSTFSSWQGVLSAVITLNLSAGVFNNGMLDYREDRDVFQFSLLAISIVSALLWLAVYQSFREILLPLIDLPEKSIYLMFMYFLFVPAYSLWGGRQRYEYKYKALSAITILLAVSSMVMGIIAVRHADEEQAAMARIFVMEGVNVAVGLFFTLVIGFRAHFRIKLDYCRYALRFNLPLVPHYLSMYVLSSSDRIMIKNMISSSATAIYSVAYTVASMITIVWQSVEASLSPWIYEKLDQKDEAPVRKITTEIVILFAGMAMFCTLLAPEIMIILAPSEYSSGIYVIPPVAAGVFFTSVYSLYMRIELFYKQTSFATLATTIAAILNIVLNYIFIRLYGAVAAGYTTMACYAFLALFHFWNVKRKGYAHIVDNRAFLRISLSVIAGSVIISFLYTYPMIRVLLIVLIAVIATCKRREIISLLRIKKGK